MKTQLLFLASTVISVTIHAGEVNQKFTLDNKDILLPIIKYGIIPYQDNDPDKYRWLNKRKYFNNIGITCLTLSCTNRTSREHYTDEKFQQAIIDAVSIRYSIHSHSTIARKLHFKNTFDKIKHFHHIASEPTTSFTQEQLDNHWYIHSTSYKYLDFSKDSLLIPAIRNRDIKKIKMLLDAEVDIHGTQHRTSPLELISQLMNELTKNTSISKHVYTGTMLQYSAIIELLQTHKTKPFKTTL
jgi:hypothetical protein